MTMNRSSSAPMAIFVHHELSVPWNEMIVWIETEDEHAERASPDDVPDAAGEQRAADDDRGDRVELHADGVQAVAGEHVEGEQQAAERGAEAADHVDADLRAGRPRRPISSAELSLPPMA